MSKTQYYENQKRLKEMIMAYPSVIHFDAMDALIKMQDAYLALSQQVDEMRETENKVMKILAKRTLEAHENLTTKQP
jgi:cephalosporin-C deacetylase-like acetyl esterase